MGSPSERPHRKGGEMNYEKLETVPGNKLKEWAVNWLSDWFGLFDILVGIVTLTAYYPNTQGWWFGRYGR